MESTKRSTFKRFFLYPILTGVIILLLYDLIKGNFIPKTSNATSTPKNNNETPDSRNENATDEKTLAFEKTKSVLDNNIVQENTELVYKNTIRKSNILNDNTEITTDYWKKRFFKSVKKDTWNVIVKSLGSDYNRAVRITNELKRQYPNFHFRLTYTVAKDGESNPMYAIYFGNGLTKSEAQEAVKIAKKYNIANDAYAVIQLWDTGGDYQ